MPLALYALTAGAFGIGTTEFVIMGLLTQVAADLQVSIAAAGLLISGYALGVFVGAPLLTIATGRLPRKAVLVGLMVVFTLGNLACALAPDYGWLMAARVITSLAHGTFFGVGAVVATSLVTEDRKASAISVMFTGLTVATLLGVPAGRMTVELHDERRGDVRIVHDRGGPQSGPLAALTTWRHRMAVSPLPGDRSRFRDRLDVGGAAAPAMWPTLWVLWQWRGHRLQVLARRAG